MAPPISTPIPGVGEYGNAAALAKQAYQNAVARSNQNIKTALAGYGYQGTIDPSGQVSNIGVDPHAQYGAYQNMLRTHGQTFGGLQNAAVGKHLHGGLAKQILSQARVGFGGDANTLGQQVIGAVGGHADEISQAGYQQNSALWAAELQALRDAIQNQQFNTVGSGGY